MDKNKCKTLYDQNVFGSFDYILLKIVIDSRNYEHNGLVFDYFN